MFDIRVKNKSVTTCIFAGVCLSLCVFSETQRSVSLSVFGVFRVEDCLWETCVFPFIQYMADCILQHVSH